MKIVPSAPRHEQKRSRVVACVTHPDCPAQSWSRTKAGPVCNVCASKLPHGDVVTISLGLRSALAHVALWLADVSSETRQGNLDTFYRLSRSTVREEMDAQHEVDCDLAQLSVIRLLRTLRQIEVAEASTSMDEAKVPDHNGKSNYQGETTDPLMVHAASFPPLDVAKRAKMPCALPVEAHRTAIHTSYLDVARSSAPVDFAESPPAQACVHSMSLQPTAPAKEQCAIQSFGKLQASARNSGGCVIKQQVATVTQPSNKDFKASEELHRHEVFCESSSTLDDVCSQEMQSSFAEPHTRAMSHTSESASSRVKQARRERGDVARQQHVVHTTKKQKERSHRGTSRGPQVTDDDLLLDEAIRKNEEYLRAVRSVTTSASPDCLDVMDLPWGHPPESVMDRMITASMMFATTWRWWRRGAWALAARHSPSWLLAAADWWLQARCAVL
jgi:hypothetical protein